MNLNLFVRHGLQQQQQQQQQLNPVMIDSTSNRNTNTSTMRTAVLRASHQRTNPTGKKKKKKNIKCVKMIRRRFVSLGKQPTFRDATRHYFPPAKQRLRNDCRNSILMTHHYPDLGSVSDWSCCVGNLLQPIRSTAQI